MGSGGLGDTFEEDASERVAEISTDVVESEGNENYALYNTKSSRV